MNTLTARKSIISKIMFALILLVFISGATGWMVKAEDGGGEGSVQQPPQFEELGPTFSEEGFIIDEPVQRLVMVADTSQTKASIQIPLDESIDLSVKGSSYEITFIPAGEKDKWGKVCLSFPDSAKTAFNYAANVWASIINSNVPITIKACWANLDSGILGYSGGGLYYKNFPNAPFLNTWYASSLANAFIGSDIDPDEYDMHITYNSIYDWYYETDGHPTYNTYDLVTVAAHEIAHGLNFSGSASVSGVTGSFGGGTGYPIVYDRFIRDGFGVLLINYTNPSTALGSLLTSNNLWFQGENASLANNGVSAKIYAPSIWVDGTSYSHLDYSTFSTTINNMMVYAISNGIANHNPGPVTVGILKDLGWKGTLVPPTVVSASDGSETDKVIVNWSDSANASYYQVFRNTINSTTDITRLSSYQESSPYNDLSVIPEENYYYWIKACNVSDCSEYSISDVGFTIEQVLDQFIYLPLISN